MDSIWTLLQKEALSFLYWTVNIHAFAVGGFTMLIFQGNLLHNHPWKDSLEQRGHYLCLQKWQRLCRDVSQHMSKMCLMTCNGKPNKWWSKLDNNATHCFHIQDKDGRWWWWLSAKSCPTLATPWTVAHQAPLSIGFSREEYWRGLPLGSSKPRDWIRVSCISCIGRQVLYH